MQTSADGFSTQNPRRENAQRRTRDTRAFPSNPRCLSSSSGCILQAAYLHLLHAAAAETHKKANNPLFGPPKGSRFAWPRPRKPLASFAVLLVARRLAKRCCPLWDTNYIVRLARILESRPCSALPRRGVAPNRALLAMTFRRHLSQPSFQPTPGKPPPEAVNLFLDVSAWVSCPLAAHHLFAQRVADVLAACTIACNSPVNSQRRPSTVNRKPETSTNKPSTRHSQYLT
ncbi:hypothetical protein EDB80DRAFT_727143 [Ilyonectria destructans]|nr:hypothetical protein EDB80DRAFT_727143 [Ilyonectria destructans]